MGLKGYRLRAMGQLDSTCRAPPRRRRVHPVAAGGGAPRARRAEAAGARVVVSVRRDVAVVQLDPFEKRILKPVSLT